MELKLQLATLTFPQIEVVEAATVDAFQGREKRVLIVHFVAAFRRSANPCGHISKPQRLCVATTRAKEFEFMVGNLTLWKSKVGASADRKEHKWMEDLVKWVTQKGQLF